MQARSGYRIVPVGYILTNGRRPRAEGILVEVVHDEHIHRFSSEGATYPESLEAPSVTYYLTLIRIAGIGTVVAPHPLWSTPCEEGLWKQLLVAFLL